MKLMTRTVEGLGLIMACTRGGAAAAASQFLYRLSLPRPLGDAQNHDQGVGAVHECSMQIFGFSHASPPASGA